MLAVSSGSIELVSMFMDTGADVNAQDKVRESHKPLHMCVHVTHLLCIHALPLLYSPHFRH